MKNAEENFGRKLTRKIFVRHETGKRDAVLDLNCQDTSQTGDPDKSMGLYIRLCDSPSRHWWWTLYSPHSENNYSENEDDSKTVSERSPNSIFLFPNEKWLCGPLRRFRKLSSRQYFSDKKDKKATFLSFSPCEWMEQDSRNTERGNIMDSHPAMHLPVKLKSWGGQKSMQGKKNLSDAHGNQMGRNIGTQSPLEWFPDDISGTPCGRQRLWKQRAFLRALGISWMILLLHWRAKFVKRI